MKSIIKVCGLFERKRRSSKSAVDYLFSLQESFTASFPPPLLNCLFLLEFSISTALLVLNSVEVTLPVSTKQIQQHSLNLSFAMMLERKPNNGWYANTDSLMDPAPSRSSSAHFLQSISIFSLY